MLVVVLLSGLAIVLLANFKTRLSIGLQGRALEPTVGLILVLSTLIGCGTGTTAFGTGSAVGGTGNGTGTGGGGSTVTATSISNLTVNPSIVAAGSSTAATVTLNAPAPAGGAKVTLTSGNASVVSAPASVTVAAGQTSVNFAVTTGNVSSAASVSITASYNNTVASVAVSVEATATPTPISISILPSSASLLAGASQQFTATVVGSTNTSVSWTTTGGNITNAGLFTAPNVSSATILIVYATSQADPSVAATAQVTVTPAPTPPPPADSTGTYSGVGPVAAWQAYLYLDTDNLYHQAIEIYNAQAAYPVIGYSYVGPGCTNLGDTFNDFWQPIGNGIWWFIHDPNLVYVTWVWYNNATDKQILQQTPCIDYSGAPKYN